MSKRSPFRLFKAGPEIIRLAVMLYVRFPLSFRNVEDLLHERDVDVSHEAIRLWWQAVDHEGEVLESFVTKTRDREAALKFLKKPMRKHGRTEAIARQAMFLRCCTERARGRGSAGNWSLGE